MIICLRAMTCMPWLLHAMACMPSHAVLWLAAVLALVCTCLVMLHSPTPAAGLARQPNERVCG